MSWISEVKVLLKAVRKANSRLRRIEKYAKEPQFKGIEKFAYAKAQKMIAELGGSAKNRFSSSTPKNERELQKRMSRINEFLDMKTSTKKGIIETYKKRADTLNKKYMSFNENGKAEGVELKFTWQQLATFWEKTYDKMAAKKYSSDTILQAMGYIQNQDEEVLKNLRENQKNNIVVSGTKEVQRAIDEFLKDDTIDWSELV